MSHRSSERAASTGIPWSSAWALRVSVFLGLLACLFYAFAEWRATGSLLGFPLDDSWIHLQFARNLAGGEGLSYREGRLVGGSTGPLFSALLSIVFLLPVNPLIGAKVLGVASFVATVPGLLLLTRRYRLSSSVAFLVCLLFLFTDWMVWSSLSGMEVALFVCLSTWGLALHASAGHLATEGAWMLFAAGALVRPEGLLLLALSLADKCLERSREDDGTIGFRIGVRQLRRFGTWGLLAGALLLPVAVFHVYAHGSPFPTTLGVKTDAAHRWIPSLRDLWSAAEVLFRPQAAVMLLAVIGAAQLLWEQGKKGGRSLLPVLWLVGLPVALSALSAPGTRLYLGNFGRYMFPLFPALILLGGLGVERIQQMIPGVRVGRLRLGTRWLLPVLVTLPTFLSFLSGAPRYARNVRNVNQSDVEMGRWIAANLPSSARLAVQDIGAIGYHAPNPILDLAGIVNPEILPVLRAEPASGTAEPLARLFAFIERARVDFLVLYPESYGGWEALQRIEPRLEVIHRMAVPNNITMAGSELAILLAPWSPLAESVRASKEPPPQLQPKDPD